ncbi:MAG: hypothetical protein ACRDHO_06070, partial [Actinomycetota bacterium]
MGALTKQLKAMHVPGQNGWGVQGFIGGSHLDQAVCQWKGFWDPASLPDSLPASFPASLCAADAGPNEALVSQATQARYVSPLWLATLFMILDFALFIPAYIVATVLVMARNHHALSSDWPRLSGWARRTAPLILVVAALDIIENSLTLLLVHDYWNQVGRARGWMDSALGMVASLKWVLGLFVILVVLLLALVRWKDSRQEARTTVRLLRAQLGVALIALALLLFLPFQLVDLILRISLKEAAFVLLFAVIFGAAMWSISRIIVTRYEGSVRIECRRGPPPWLLAALAAFLVAVICWNAATKGDVWGPLIPIIMVVVLFAIGYLVGDAPKAKADAGEEMPPELLAPGIFVPQLLAAASISIVGLVSIQAAVGSYVQKGEIAVPVGLASFLFALSFLALLVTFEVEYRLVRGRGGADNEGPRSPAWVVGAERIGGPRRRRRRYAIVAATTAAATLVAASLLVASPITVPQDLGSIGIILVFLSAISLALGGLVWLADSWADGWGMPRALRVLKLKRIPVMTLLLIWAIVAATVDDGSHWNVRTLGGSGEGGSTKYPGITLNAAFEAWLSKAATREGQAQGGGRTRIPLVLVATSGGGIKSAYWTALAMDCLFGGHMASTATSVESDPCRPTGARPPQPEDVFLASGASGGSVGLVEWDAHRDLLPYEASWVEERMGADFVAPTVAKGLLVEVPRSFLHFSAQARDDVLEQAWERAWADARPNPMERGFLASQDARMRSGGPFLMLNGSSVFDGCSLNVSILDMGSTVDQKEKNTPPSVPLADCRSVARYTDPKEFSEPPGPLPGTADIVDYLGCDNAIDIRRSTAGLLSARFPIASGAGRLTACGLEASTKYIDDGGIVDNSGAEPLLSAWIAIEPLVQAH